MVGIDVSKAHLDVAVEGKRAVVRFDNDAPGCAALTAAVAGAELVVVEATGCLRNDLITLLLDDAPCSKPPPPRHLPQAEFQNNPPRRLRRHLERLGHHPCRHQRLCHDELDQFRQF